MMKKQNVRTIALIVTTFTYLLIGAAIFDALESVNEEDERTRLKEEELSIQVKYNITDEDLEKLTVNILKFKPYRAGIQWKFAGAFYFALSVITTIGYGHSTPKTLWGKLFCIGYALIGIPLNIVMFQSIGERFNIGITIVLRKIKKCINLKKVNVTQTELTVLACILCTTVLIGGAGAFHYFESWEFTDAFYYCFITMSTIGFGDFVALQSKEMLALQKRPEYVAFSILYILFGLTVFAAALNLMVLRLLTMNTEDERKDELEALAAARGAVKLDGDVITPGTQSTTVSSLARDIEGMQIEAAANSNDSLNQQQSCLKMQDSFNSSNGIVCSLPPRKRISKRITGLSWLLPSQQSFDVNPSGQDNLCISQSEVTSNGQVPQEVRPSDHQEEEEVVAGLETVIADFPPDYRITKRCSV